MTNQEIITTGQTIANETHIGGNTAERVGGVIEGIGENLTELNRDVLFSIENFNSQNSVNYFDDGIENKYLSNTGRIMATTAATKLTQMIPVKEGDVLLFRGTFSTGLYLIHGYVNIDDLTSVAQLLPSGSYSITEVVIPSGVNYVRAWSLTTNTAYVPLFVKKDALRKKIDELNTAMEGVNASMENSSADFMLAAVNSMINYFDFAVHFDNYFLLNSGNRSYSASLNSILTDYIPVKEGQKYRYIGGWTTNASVCYVCGYASKDTTSVQILVPADAATKDVEITIPSGVNYIRAWSQTRYNPKLYCTSGDIANRLTEGEGRIDTLENDYQKVIVGRNLYDKTKAIQGKYVIHSSGALGDLSSYSASDFIPVKPNTAYIQAHNQQIAFYDANKTYISGLSSSAGGYTTPNNCYFLRICNATSLNDTQQVNEGTSLLPYEPAYYGIKDMYVPASNVLATAIGTTIVATRNAADYNSIRNIMDGITDASAANPYTIIVPKGRWFESDIHGKQYVTIIGEDREESIIYCDGTSSNVTPNDYSYPNYANMALSEIPTAYKHCIYAEEDVIVKNLTIEDCVGKYCVHLDYTNYGIASFENCHFIAKETVNYAVGIGIRGGQQITFKDCIFERTEDEKLGVFAHNWNNQSNPSVLSFRDCYFKNCGFIMIDELGSEQEDNWELLNCHSDVGGEVGCMVDVNSNGKTYWTNPSTGEKESDPTAVPYCIKLNCCGSNVGKIAKSYFGSTSTISRPNMEKYIIAASVFSLNGNYDAGKVYHGVFYGRKISIINNEAYPVVCVATHLIGGKMYFVGKGNIVPVLNENIYGTTQTANTRVFENSQHYLTTNSSDAIAGTSAIGVIVGDYLSVGKYVYLYP